MISFRAMDAEMLTLTAVAPEEIATDAPIASDWIFESSSEMTLIAPCVLRMGIECDACVRLLFRMPEFVRLVMTFRLMAPVAAAPTAVEELLRLRAPASEMALITLSETADTVISPADVILTPST